MYETFVEHAQDDVNRHQRRENQPRLARQRTLESLGRALEGADDRTGHAQLGHGLVEDAHGIAQGHARGQVEGQVGGGKQAVMGDRQWAGAGRLDPRQRRQRDHFATLRGTQVEVIEAFGLAPLLGVKLENHLVLVGFGLELADLALAEGVIKRLVDIGGGQAEAGGGDAVDVDAGNTASQLQVVGHVAKGRVGAQAFGQALGPQVELGAVVALEHVLVLAAAGAGAEVDVLAGAQVQHNARYLGHFRPQFVDELAD
ncbi:hypothetical protein D9M71_131210 [compost metagenome]